MSILFLHLKWCENIDVSALLSLLRCWNLRQKMKTSIEKIFIDGSPSDDSRRKKMVMNSRIIYVVKRCFFAGKRDRKDGIQKERRKRGRQDEMIRTWGRNIGKEFKLQIIRNCQVSSLHDKTEQLVNRIESNSIKEINLIGLGTFFSLSPHSFGECSSNFYCQKGKLAVSHC